MVSQYFKYIVIILVIHLSVNLSWSQTSIFSEVRVNKNSVYVGEALEVTIGVYTSTWFTLGVDIGNISINGGFSVYFSSVSTVKKIKGKSYAGVQFIYNVFPFEKQDVVIPSLTVQVETPNEGGYKGVKRTLKTKARTIKLKPYPPGIDKATWMVTTSMSVNEQWLGNTKTIKVGDVIERKITRRASGTVSELIPPVIWDSIPNTSLYPSQSALNTNKTKTAISAIRTDGIRYLFEEEGDVIIPDMEFLWWHPYRKKFYKKTVKGLTVTVRPNPDLEMLKTAKAELSISAQDELTESEPEEILIFGFTLKQFLLGLIIISVISYVLLKVVIKSVRYLKQKNAIYKKSEAFAFKQVLKSIRSKDKTIIIPLLYNWIDLYNLDEPTLKAFALKSGYLELIEEVDYIEKQLNQESNALLIRKDTFKKGRVCMLKTKIASAQKNWINP